jgi:ATP-dependent Clp protease protease subunit
MVRTIVEERSKNIAVMDVYSKLAQDRIIFIEKDIDDDLANGVASQLMYLDSLNNNEITIYINSYGGSVYDGFAIIDVMRRIKSPVKTICIGKAMSMAALILICGDTRQATDLATIMLHQPSGGTIGTATDMEINIKEVIRLKKIFHNILKKKTSIKDPEKEVERDYYLDADEAKELNIIDEIIYPIKGESFLH